MSKVKRTGIARWSGLLVAVGVLVAAQPAQALEFTSSSLTGKQVIRWGLGGDVPLPGPLAISAKASFIPNLNDLLGDSAFHTMLIDGEATLGWKIDLPNPLEGIGLKPALVPYAGARYLGVPMAQASLATQQAGYNQLAGVSYGLKAVLGLPLDITGMAYAGATSFVWGRYGLTGLDGTSQSGAIDPVGATVPVAGVQVAWAPLNLFTIYAGAETSQLPDGLRTTDGQLGPGRVPLTTLRAGLSFLFFSI